VINFVPEVNVGGDLCSLCNGTGFIVVEKNGVVEARPCECRRPDHVTRLIERASIPKRYRRRYVFETYRPIPGTTQEEALALAKKYASDYPVLPGAVTGLLFIGPCGVGKTHLAVSILQEVLMRKNLPAVFVDLNELYREIRSTYGALHKEESEYDILTPLAEAPLLLIDELGCVDSAWAQDTLHYLVSRRYNEQRPTLLTTNYLDVAPEGESSLEERIGVRTRSRLHEMCRTINMDGPDYRSAPLKG